MNCNLKESKAEGRASKAGAFLQGFRLSTLGSRRSPPQGSAFTLIELLLVITIIGILAALGLPHLKGWGEGNTMASGTRQLMDVLSAARQKSISSRSTVYVVFISPEVANATFYSSLSPADKKQAQVLFSGQYTTYALFSERPVGEQPGHKNPRYLTPWKSLPEKVFIPTNKFTEMPENIRFTYPETNRPFATNFAFPFPTVASGKYLNLPYVAFNSQGQLISEKNNSGQYEGLSIPLTKGSIFYARDAAGALTANAADVIETPGQNSLTNYNNVRVDWLTGRNRLERREF